MSRFSTSEATTRTEHVAEAFPGCAIRFGGQGSDNRSYRVDFSKVAATLPGFSCAWDAHRGAHELAAVFANIDLDYSTFTGRGHTRLTQLQHLLDTKQLDAHLI